MAITVIGFFRVRSEAEDAVKELTGSGFYRNDIDISYGSFVTPESTSNPGSTYPSDDNSYEANDNSYRSDTNTSDVDISSNISDDNISRLDNNPDEEINYRHDKHKDRKGNAITRFFNSLFGDDSDDAKKYSAVSQRADSIVTVHAGTSEQAEEAANILDACGAMDIDEGDLVSDTYHSVDSKVTPVDPDLSRERVERIEKPTSIYPSDIDRTGSEITRSDEKIRITETDTRLRTKLQTIDTDSIDSSSIGLTDQDLADAGLSPEEIRSVEDISGGNLRSSERRRSRIIERQIDDDLRLREEHDRLHREG